MIRYNWIKKRRGRIAIFGSCLFFICLAGWYRMLPDPLFDSPYSTVLEDRSGRLAGVLVAADGQFRFEESDVLPFKYVTAVLAFEDKYFMLHRGVDWRALGRALFQNIRAGSVVSGGSTLSMQVVRLSRKNPPRTIGEKLREVLLTLRMEQSYSKYEILCKYASHAPFGGNIVGLSAASAKYFDRPPGQLSWSEAALLAVLPNAPSLIFPGRNNLLLKGKRDRLLKRLLDHGVIGEEDYTLALAEPLPGKVLDIPCAAPHLLMRANLERPGKVTRANLDTHLQERVNKVVERHSGLLSHNYIYNAAVLVAHIPTGEVRAYVGNSPALPGSRGNEVDIIPSVRSSGSILKPALYALMQQYGFILPRTLLPDVPSRFGNYAPSNFNGEFKGVVPADDALAQSLNIPFVRLLKDYSYGRFYDDLRQMGITSLTREAGHYGLSLILGGAEVSLWDVCNMYGGMASVLRHYNERDGRYLAGEYNRMRLWSGEERKEQNEAVPLLSADAVWLTLKALQSVERPEIESGWKNFASSMNLSWKTGTSFGFRDAWAVGVNPEYVIGVWVGNADGEGRPGLVGVRAAAPILFEVAALLPSARQFYEPWEEMQQAVVCRKSGFRASVFCVETDTVRICEAGIKAALCPYHRLVNLDASGTWRVNSGCEPVRRMKVEPWFVLTPVQEWYYCRSHTDYRRLPPYRKDCRPEREDVMEMIYPQRGTRVFLPRDFDGRKQAAVFEAAHREPAAEVYWYVDDRYLGLTRDVHQMEVQLSEGRHVLTLMDADGNMLKQAFGVVGRE